MSFPQPVKVLTILLVEDSRSDAILILETLGESKLINEIHHVRDGVEATDSSGLNVVIQLNAAIPELPLIVLTGLVDILPAPKSGGFPSLTT